MSYANGAAASMPDDDLDGWLPSDDDAPAESSVEMLRALPPSGPRVFTPRDVVASWRSDGPLVHEPTGIATLDDLTGGGLVYGSRVYLVGAPDAGKTAVEVEIAAAYLSRGILCGFLAVDEEPGDLLTRLAQRAGWTRRSCEERDIDTLEGIAEHFKDVPIRFYDDGHTIESAAADLAARAAERRTRAALFVDSVQTCRSQAGDAAENPRELVTANVRAIRAAATTHKLIAVATSEMNRGAYRTVDAAETTNDMAAGKESGAIEFSARLLLALRSVRGESDMLEMRVAKNKHGPSGGRIFLRIDRRHMIVSETSAPDVPAEEREAGTRSLAKNARRVKGDARVVADLILRNQGIGERDLRAKLAAAGHGWGRSRLDAAKEHLGPSLVNRGENARCVRWHLVSAPPSEGAKHVNKE